jgi:hypothetical protein
VRRFTGAALHQSVSSGKPEVACVQRSDYALCKFDKCCNKDVPEKPTVSLLRQLHSIDESQAPAPVAKAWQMYRAKQMIHYDETEDRLMENVRPGTPTSGSGGNG